jgi:signal transduction histidine kinase
LPQIFEPFFTTKAEPQRTGLGLAVAHSIIEQHGGAITVRSRPGEGTEFTVVLPAAVAAAVETRI